MALWRAFLGLKQFSAHSSVQRNLRGVPIDGSSRFRDDRVASESPKRRWDNRSKQFVDDDGEVAPESVVGTPTINHRKSRTPGWRKRSVPEVRSASNAMSHGSHSDSLRGNARHETSNATASANRRKYEVNYNIPTSDGSNVSNKVPQTPAVNFQTADERLVAAKYSIAEARTVADLRSALALLTKPNECRRMEKRQAVKYQQLSCSWALSKAKKLGLHGDTASLLLSDLRASGAKPNVYVYGAAIEAVASAPGSDRVRWRGSGEMNGGRAALPGRPGRGAGGNITASSGSGASETSGRSESKQPTTNFNPAAAALELLEAMQKVDYLVPNEHCFGSTCKALARAPDLDAAADRALRIIKVEMPRARCVPNVVAVNAALNVLGRAGAWREAVDLLDDMVVAHKLRAKAVDEAAAAAAHASSPQAQSSSSPSSSGGPSGGARTSSSEDAAALERVSMAKWRRMPAPDVASFSAVINACHAGGQPAMATGVLRLMASFGVLPNIVCVNSAMAAAAKAGHVSYALRLMDALRGTFGTEEDEYGRPIFGGSNRVAAVDNQDQDSIRYDGETSPDNDGGGGGDASHADGDTGELPDLSHLKPDVWSYAIAIQSSARVHNWRGALALLEEAEATPGVYVNDVAYTNAIAACSASGEWKHAVGLLRRMHLHHAKRLEAMKKGGNSSSSGSGWTRKAEASSASMIDGSAFGNRDLNGPGVVAYNACITACGRAGQVQAALSVLHAMLLGNFEQGQLTGSSQSKQALEGAGGVTRAEEAVKAIALAAAASQDDGQVIPDDDNEDAAGAAHEPSTRKLPRPDAVSYNAALHACERAGMWRVALQLLDVMPAHLRDAVSFNTAMVACGRAGQWRATLELLHDLEALSDTLGPLNAHSYGAALTACAQAAEVSIGCNSDDGIAAAEAGASLLERSGETAAWRSSVACLGPAAAVLRAAGKYEEALVLELELRKADPKQAMRLDMRRRLGSEAQVPK